jgi:ABC-type glycerol-3-phosphate transport system substrate-binding protein
MVVSVSFLLAEGQQEAEAEGKAGMEKTPIETYNPDFQFPEERITLDYWHVLGSREGYHQLAQEIAAEYTRIHPNVTINVRQIPNAQQRAIWTTAFESNTAPDIAWIEAQVGLMNEGLLPAPDWVTNYMEENFTDYALSLCKVKGTIYGWNGAEVDAGQMLYYRKDLFNEAGLDPNAPPTTATELVEKAKKLTEMDSSGNMTQAGVALRYAGGPQGIGDKFSKYAAAFVNTQERFFYNEDYSEVILDDPGWIEAAQYYQDLVFKHKVTNTNLPIPINAFGQGLAAMTNRESFFAGWLGENFPDVADNFGIAPLVDGEYKTGAMPWLAFQGVTVDAENPEIAWDFNLFMIQPDNELRIVKNNGGFSRLKAHQGKAFFEELPYYETFKLMTEEKPLVRNPYLDPNTLVAELETKVGEVAVELITNPDADAETLMNDIDDYADNRLEEVQSMQ